MLRFKNPHNHSVQLSGPNKEIICFLPKEIKVLSGYFSKYCPKYISIVNDSLDIKSSSNNEDKNLRVIVRGTKGNKRSTIRSSIKNANIKNTNIRVKKHGSGVRNATDNNTEQTNELLQKIEESTKSKKSKRAVIRSNKHNDENNKVGITQFIGNKANNMFNDYLHKSMPLLSNDIGVGILSFNRLNSIKRLLTSIKKYIDNKTTIFVSDESTDQSVKDYLKSLDWIVLLDNNERLGIAGNSNRLLRCLSRFKYKLLLNDDVEILQSGWEYFYPNFINKTNIHHFLYFEDNLYGMNRSSNRKNYNGYNLNVVDDKPHGAVMAFDNVAFDTVGYFDTKFGIYGREHTDWSNRCKLSGIQQFAYCDIAESSNYFKIHNDKSAINDKVNELTESNKIFDSVKNDNNRIYVNPDKNSEVKSVSCIIPCKLLDRDANIVYAVINGIKRQIFPNIDIVVSELDLKQKLKLDSTVTHCFTKYNLDFNKSIAFNNGVSKSKYEYLILHDADMVADCGYIRQCSNILDSFESFHIGKHVFYLDKNSTDRIFENNSIDYQIKCDRIVGYYEGGSLGCRKSIYENIGGFCEQFIGWGCEDCEFFGRLTSTNMMNDRFINLIHLYHNRSSNWSHVATNNNKIYEALKQMPMNQRINAIKQDYINKYKG